MIYSGGIDSVIQIEGGSGTPNTQQAQSFTMITDTAGSIRVLNQAGTYVFFSLNLDGYWDPRGGKDIA